MTSHHSFQAFQKMMVVLYSATSGMINPDGCCLRLFSHAAGYYTTSVLVNL